MKQITQKTVLLLNFLLIICCIQIATAQDYKPFPTTNAMWRESTFSRSGGEEYQYLIIGDSVINGKTYHKLQKSGIGVDGSDPSHIYEFTFNYYFGCFRNDTLERKVWYILPNNSQEQLLYDFNLQIGDSLPATSYFGIGTVANIDTLSLNDGLHKRFEISYGFYDSFYIIEGIGSTLGLHYLSADERVNLKCFSFKGEKIYPDEIGICDTVKVTVDDYEKKLNNFSIYPNPAYTTFQIRGLDHYQHYSISIFNIYGQLVKQEQGLRNDDMIHIDALHKGIYIVNISIRKKVVTKCKLIKL